MINVNYKTISKWENGNSLPNLDILTQLCEIYNVSLYEMSVYKRIKSRFISAENIKKIINKQSITKFIVLKVIILFIIIALLIFTAYSCIYTVNNYGKIEIYELGNQNSKIDIKGIILKVHNHYYLSISKIKLLTKDEYINDKTKKLKYTLLLNNQNIESKTLKFEKETKIKDALSTINTYISRELKNNKEIVKMNILIRYEQEKDSEKRLNFEITPEIKKCNNKLIY